MVSLKSETSRRHFAFWFPFQACLEGFSAVSGTQVLPPRFTESTVNDLLGRAAWLGRLLLGRFESPHKTRAAMHQVYPKKTLFGAMSPRQFSERALKQAYTAKPTTQRVSQPLAHARCHIDSLYFGAMKPFASISSAYRRQLVHNNSAVILGSSPFEPLCQYHLFPTQMPAWYYIRTREALSSRPMPSTAPPILSPPPTLR